MCFVGQSKSLQANLLEVLPQSQTPLSCYEAIAVLLQRTLSDCVARGELQCAWDRQNRMRYRSDGVVLKKNRKALSY